MVIIVVDATDAASAAAEAAAAAAAAAFVMSTGAIAYRTKNSNGGHAQEQYAIKQRTLRGHTQEQ